MISPLPIGIFAVTVAVVNKHRSLIRFQNTSAAQVIYLKKIPLAGVITPVSFSDYEVILFPLASVTEVGDDFSTNSISGFQAISSAIGGTLAIYETQKL